jgi:hypothetical protein
VSTDDVTIELPAGFELEEPRAPAPINVGKMFLYQPHIEYARRTGRLIFKREYTFNGFRLPAVLYPQIKSSFDRLAVQDSHKLALRRVKTEPASPATSDEASEAAVPLRSRHDR